MESRQLETAAEVCEVLGIPQIAKMTGRKYSAAHNWKGFGRFPSDTFVVMKAALKEAGCAAPDALWGMVHSEPLAPADNHADQERAAS